MEVSENFNTSKFGRYILFVGRLVEYKGISYLIEAIKNIDINLVIVGSGLLEKDIKKQIKTEKLDQKIFLLTNIELQKDNYDTNLGSQNIDYSPNADKNSDESVETGFGLGVLSNLFGLGGVFGGVTALVTVIFPTAMTGFILWFIGAAVSIFVLFILLEIYFAVRGNKQK